MIRYAFAFLVMATSVAAIREIKTGMIQYELRMDMHRRIPEERADMKSMIPQYRTEKYNLFFNPTTSHYKVHEEEEDDFETNRGGMRIRMQMPKTETYLDLQSKARSVYQEFMGKKYIIEDTLDILPWKFGTEKLEILGYTCQMAYHTDTTNNQEITAWFTQEIMPFVGPDQYANLPGTVLAVDINNGERTWIARKINFGELKKDDIKKPTKGEVMSREAYRAMVEEQMQKMRQSGGIRFGG